MLRSIAVMTLAAAMLVAACGDPSPGSSEEDFRSVATASTDQPGEPDEQPRPIRDPGAPTLREAPGEVRPVQGSPPPTLPIAPEPGTLLGKAVADLAARLGVDVSAVGVVSVEEVTWRDGAAGCPQPDMVYTQALVNGSRIRLLVDGDVYQYHTRGAGDPFLCADPEEPASSAGGLGDS